MRPTFAGITGSAVLLCLLSPIASVRPAGAQQISAEKAAAMMLDSARRAYNERQYPLAVDRFRKFIGQYGNHRARYDAQYGLALALLEAPQPDRKAIHEALRQALANPGLAGRSLATYYQGSVLRDMGMEAMKQSEAQGDAGAKQKLLATANQHFTQAAQVFAVAAASFAREAAPAPAKATKLTAEAEWAARARCDYCEMLLRLKQFPQARAAAQEVLSNALTAKSRCRQLALYHLGYAHFASKEYLQAGRALSQLAPFNQDFGIHARYLLGRTHHLAGERPEASAQYRAVLAGYDAKKKDAAEALKRPQALKPRQIAELTSLVKSPPPDYLVRTSFYIAQLLTEEGKSGQAAQAFTELIKNHPKSPLVPEAQLRLGYCQLQSKNYPEAIKVLHPLCPHAELGDRAMWWTARAQVAAADPAKAQPYTAALTAAINTLLQAANKAAQKAKADPAAKARRGDILLELADTQQLAKQYKGAATTYQQVAAEGGDPQRVEEAVHRQAAALHLAGMYKESDVVCRRFASTYPRSTLLAAVLFRSAENAYFTAVVAAKDPKTKGSHAQLFAETVRRYRQLLKLSGDFHYAHLARQGLATLYYRQERYDEAIAVLKAIPESDRTGALAAASHMLADCYLRTLPAESDDAVGAARLIARVDQAAKLLEGFVGANKTRPEAPDALLKLGYCYRRIGSLMTNPTERVQRLTLARTAYERIQKEFPKSAAMPMAVFERACCMALMGDPRSAINDLKRFQADPLQKAPVAPLALVRMASLTRALGRAAEAVQFLAAYRTQQEANLLKDPDRRDWAAMLQYQHALALKETKKPAEALKLFDALAAAFPGRPEGINAVWQAGQCRREELTAKLAAAKAAAVKPGAKPAEIAAAEQQVDQAVVQLRQAVSPVHAQAVNVGKTAPGSDAHQRLLYEAAWCYRTLADAEVEDVRERLQTEALKAVLAQLAKRTPAGQAPPKLAPPEIPLAKIPLQPSEIVARAQYEALIAAAPTAPLAVQARYELAEILAQRTDDPDDVTAAVKLLTDALAANPPKPLADEIRLRLAGCFLTRKDPKAALAQLAGLGPKPAHYLTDGKARYLAAEAYVQQKAWAKAIERLVPFRDQGNYANIPHVSDRALVRLAQAYAETKQWAPSLQACQLFTQRYRYSLWLDDAFYGIGWALQSQKQHEAAIKAYTEVTKRTASVTAARAQFQIGMCWMAQAKHAEAAAELLAVPLTYDYPEWSAAARCQAAKAYAALKQPTEAARLYRQVLRDSPTSQWAAVAKEGLGQIK